MTATQTEFGEIEPLFALVSEYQNLAIVTEEIQDNEHQQNPIGQAFFHRRTKKLEKIDFKRFPDIVTSEFNAL